MNRIRFHIEYPTSAKVKSKGSAVSKAGGRGPGHIKDWTPAEDALLQQHYFTRAANDIPGLEHRGECSVRQRALRLGMRKDREVAIAITTQRLRAARDARSPNTSSSVDEFK